MNLVGKDKLRAILNENSPEVKKIHLGCPSDSNESVEKGILEVFVLRTSLVLYSVLLRVMIF